MSTYKLPPQLAELAKKAKAIQPALITPKGTGQDPRSWGGKEGWQR